MAPTRWALLEHDAAGRVGHPLPNRLVGVGVRKLDDFGQSDVLILPELLVGVDELGYLAGIELRLEGKDLRQLEVGRDREADGAGKAYGQRRDQADSADDAAQRNRTEPVLPRVRRSRDHAYAYWIMAASRRSRCPSGDRRNSRKCSASGLGADGSTK